YITDVKELTTTLRNGQDLPVRWLQFKIPIFEPTEAIGGIADFRSIRFIRMFLSDFRDPTILRFGTMDLVRGDYRRYNQSLFEDQGQIENPNTLFEVNAVNIEENENRQPIPYVLPPGVEREELFQSNSNIRQNEQSLSLRVCELEPQDARAVYKNFQIDMRQYKNLEMFLHAESFINKPPLKDGQLVAFVRMGTDFSDNFYQIEIPLSPTLFGATSPEEIWPEINRLNLELDLLQQIKTAVLGDPSLVSTELNFFTEELLQIDAEAPYDMGRLRLGVKGNPSFGNIRLLMVGVKNGTRVDGVTELCGEVWFNELRLSDLKNEGGWAGVVSMDTNLADFANISATGRRSTVGFGSIEQGPNQRSQEDLQQYDVVTNVNMGQLLPQTWGVKIPVNYSRGEELITPKFDQEFLDVDLDSRLENIEDPEERDRIEKQSQSYTKRQSINVIGLRKERVGEKKPMPYDIENFAFSTSYNQIDHRDFEIEESLDQSVRVGGTYEYNFPEKTLEPLKNIAVLDSSEYFALFKDFNFNYLPSNINASSNIFRQYNEQKFRTLDLSENDIGIPTLYQRNYLFDWQYGVNYNLTRSLNFSFNASNNRIIRNYIDEEGFADDNIGLWDDFFEVGDPNLHFQTLQVNYQLPFSKIPVLRFINATYSYTGDFQWQRGSRIFDQLEGIPDIGNSVQNSNTHQINASLNLQDLYNYFGLVEKKADKAKSIQERSRGVPTLGPPGENEDEQADESRQMKYRGYNTFVSLVTGLKTFQVNYRNSRGIFLPGYTNDIGFMGTFKPTTGFTFGFQDDIRYIAAERGWLTLFQNFNQQYTALKNEQLDYQAGLDLLPDLTMELTGRRNFSENYSENYKVDPITLEYQSLTPYTYGNFNISTVLIKTAFNNSTETSSQIFENFRENRLEVARRIASERGLDPTD
ncbi:MAG: cell surface protein SprA, partial [Gramella sp.]|nr:cell surface protein SprA [Christiangramia sp.]